MRAEGKCKRAQLTFNVWKVKTFSVLLFKEKLGSMTPYFPAGLRLNVTSPRSFSEPSPTHDKVIIQSGHTALLL